MNKETKYVLSKEKVFKQTFFIWLFLLLHIIGNYFLTTIFIEDGKLIGVILLNTFFLTVNVPSLYLFYNYLNHSLNKQFIISQSSIKLLDYKSKEEIEIKPEEVSVIEIHETNSLSRAPWVFHSYFILTDMKNKKIIVPSYITNIIDFRLNPLTKKVKNERLETIKRTIPTIKNVVSVSS
jgi:hypothetical protein